MSDSWVSRRTLLGAAATTVTAAGLSATLGGCAAESLEPDQPAEATIDALTPVLIEEQQLLALYEQTLAGFPDLVTALADLNAQALAHAVALRQAAPLAAAQAAARSAGEASGSAPAPSSTDPAPPSAPPVDAMTARMDLARAVDGLAGSLRTAALRSDGDLAALLGSCAASTACHARLLAS